MNRKPLARSFLAGVLFILSVLFGMSINGADRALALEPFENQFIDQYFGCSATLRELRKRKNELKYLAFAKRRALSITGMRGCGYAWNQVNQKVADEKALANCREREKRPGQCVLVPM